MNSAVCTLFGGNPRFGYHYGLGAFINSLFSSGFRGMVYAGYDGPLPPWAKNVQTGSGYSDFKVADGLTIRFIPLQPKVHFSNYKPDFMLEVWNNQCPQAQRLFYFDPDIIIRCRWSFFEEWVEAGVAVCQDVNGSMANNHPIRHAWRKLLEPHGLEFRNCFEVYFNDGFVGVSRRDNSFLELWQHGQILMQQCGEDFQLFGNGDRTMPFSLRDQDAFNVACMVTKQKVSPVGQDGMDFQQGGYIMSHAVGRMKPWNKPFVRMALLRAFAPSRADKEFFRYVKSPIQLYSRTTLVFKRISLLTASFLGRFVRSN